MKELLTFVFSISLLSLSQALGAVLSATNSGIYIAVAGASSAKETIRFDDRLVWRPFCNIGVVQLNYADPDYSIRVNMIGPDGKLVTKTEKGKTFGANFEKGRRYENAVRGWHMGSIDAQGGYDSREGALSGPLLPAPRDLFKRGAPGLYTLEFQMQVFRINKETNGWTRELIRFPPLALKVEKPAN